MSGNELLDKMDLIDPAYIEAAQQPPRNKLKYSWIAVAACLSLVVCALTLLNRPEETFTKDPVTPNKTTATIHYNYEGEIPKANDSLTYLSEEEMFGRKDLLVFRGIVTKVQNIAIDFEGYTEIRSIATIRTTKVFLGELLINEKIDVLLPCGLDFRMEDTGIISQLKVGMEGIFMPSKYDEEEYMEMYGKVLMLRDLAPCGLGDGVRWVFLKKDNGLVSFSRNAYPGAKNAYTLEDIEEYIVKMLK